ncbi:hypothetical protein ACQJBY_051861 [Aegilops geniculata]
MESADAAGGAAGGGAPPGRAKRMRGVIGSGGGDGMEVVPWGSPPPPGQQPQPQLQGSASRICRVRASGGKDRHSKVYTSKGIRDRRVRLSVPTAIQFYDLQDRLGFDQPSKAVEWLINAASAAIDELPSLDPAAFANMPADHQAAPRAGKQQPQGSRSLCSSTSETSKWSELSLSRSDGRVGGGSSRDKEVTVASNPSAQAGSFTELLTGAGAASAGAAIASAAPRRQSWQQQPVSAVTADCVGIARPGKGSGAQVVPTYPGFRFGNAPPFGMQPAQPFNFGPSAQNQMTQFSLVQGGLATAPAPAQAGDYSLDFSMNSGYMGATRGPLQSNSPHFSNQQQQRQLQDLDDGPGPPFLYANASATAPHLASENHLTATAAMQLWNGFTHAGMKEKSKN